MLNYLGLPVAGVDARRRNRSDDRARALADAGAVRRLGRLLPVRAVPVPQGREPEGRATRARRASSPRAPKSPSRSSRSCCSSFYAIPAWATRVDGVPGRERGGRRARRRRAVRVEHALSRARRQVRPDRHQAGDAPTTRSASIARDPDAKDDITTINQLNLPVDRPVLVHLSSKDVIHSFGLYEMRVKQDAVPGHDIPVWFIPNRVGEYEIACSQLCGLGHFRMRGFVTIQSAADYQKWYDDQEKAADNRRLRATAARIDAIFRADPALCPTFRSTARR